MAFNSFTKFVEHLFSLSLFCLPINIVPVKRLLNLALIQIFFKLHLALISKKVLIFFYKLYTNYTNLYTIYILYTNYIQIIIELFLVNLKVCLQKQTFFF